jgi:hypothetical protein
MGKLDTVALMAATIYAASHSPASCDDQITKCGRNHSDASPVV